MPGCWRIRVIFVMTMEDLLHPEKRLHPAKATEGQLEHSMPHHGEHRLRQPMSVPRSMSTVRLSEMPPTDRISRTRPLPHLRPELSRRCDLQHFKISEMLNLAVSSARWLMDA
jgi:hypothetical protein